MVRLVVLVGIWLWSGLVQADELALQMDRGLIGEPRRTERPRDRVPPVIPLEALEDQATDEIGAWWIGGYDRLRAMAAKRKEGMDVQFRLGASAGTENGMDGRIQAEVTFPLFSRSDRLKAEDDRRGFLNQGLALIREGKELQQRRRFLLDQIQMQRAALRVQGFGGFEKLQAARTELVQVQERAWEVREAFEGMVGR